MIVCASYSVQRKVQAASRAQHTVVQFHSTRPERSGLGIVDSTRALPALESFCLYRGRTTVILKLGYVAVL